jgi:hypothetical protein
VRTFFRVEMKLFIFGIVLDVCFGLFQVSETPVLPQRNFIDVSTRQISFLHAPSTTVSVYTRPYAKNGQYWKYPSQRIDCAMGWRTAESGFNFRRGQVFLSYAVLW